MAFWNRTESTPPRTRAKSTPEPTPERTPEIAPQTAAKQGLPKGIPFLRPSLGSDTAVTGKLSFTAPTRIDGKLKGEVRATDLLLIGAQGSVEGILKAKSLILEGTVKGEVIGADWVEVHSTGRLIGSLEAGRIDIALGAKVQASLKIAPLQPKADTPAPQPTPKRSGSGKHKKRK